MQIKKVVQNTRLSMNERGLSSSVETGVSFEDLLAVPAAIILKAILRLGPKTADGQLVEAVRVPWYEIIRQIERNPNFPHEVDWRELEEIIAGAYKRYGCPHVVLTPRSGDDGRDIIASWPDMGSIRIVDQVKAYSPGRLVKPDEVRSMLGVLSAEPNTSKGIITTTSDFAPSIKKNPKFTQFIPYRLQLRNGPDLVRWLARGWGT